MHWPIYASEYLEIPAVSVETPSGKGAGDENFPVGSFLIAPRLRPHVAVYYDFARAIDDIADNPVLPAEEKIARLDAMDQALIGLHGQDDPAFAKALNLRQSLLQTGVAFAHARDLVIAFKQDAVKNRYQSWDELIDYCNHSAAPVGRYLLELHGEDDSAFEYSDALCNALQVINHLQDCSDDYRDMNRVYLPTGWLEAAGAKVEDLTAGKASPALRSVIDQCLSETKLLMKEAAKLPRHLVSRRLCLESSIIIRVAHNLIDELQRRDPTAGRVKLSRLRYGLCAIAGTLTGLLS